MIIQIVEDDRALSDGIVLALKEPDLEFIQDAAVREAKESFGEKYPELIILDVNLPDGSGYDYLKWVRERSQLPVLVLTANDMEMDEVMGLTLGADDYMAKPFSLAVLRARIQALMRRGRSQSSYVYEEDGLFFDFGSLVFTREGQPLSLSVNEQKLLRLFVENRGRVLTRNILIDRLWSDGGEYVDENALSVTVNRLRSKLEDKRDDISYIKTIYGQGYMWKKGDKSCSDKKP
ncbi:response regulator transcription factor [Lachnospiraceae bacterium MD308]|nr:response regulator transcription factor [Lachnospiraceae bacterium MD308]MCI8579321.1 response regulator transcription factor [Dorea sp.]